MSNSTQVDLAIIGGGPGGYVAAIRAGQLGLNTVLIEESQLGGVCLNEGCVPSKSLIHDARLIRAEHADGVLADSDLATRFSQSFDDRQPVMTKLRSGVASLLSANRVRCVDGTGAFVGPGQIETTGPTGTETIEFGAAVIATGSEATIPSSLPYDGDFVVTAREVLALRSLPSRIVVVGGGYIGLELASALMRFGVEITIIEATDRLLPTMDASLSSQLHRALVADGADIQLSTTATGATKGTVTVRNSTGDSEVHGELVVIAVGRRPRTDKIGLGTIGLETTPSGHLEVDSMLSTGITGIFAVGDVTPGPALAHRAMAQGKIAAEVVAGRSAKFDPAAIPAVVFTTPEIASVGLTIDEAKACGIPASQSRFPLAATARGQSLGTDGFGLLVFDQETQFVLGVHLIGPSAGELIGIGTLAIEMGARIVDLASLILPHPTLSEVFVELGDLAWDLPIHVTPTKARL